MFLASRHLVSPTSSRCHHSLDAALNGRESPPLHPLSTKSGTPKPTLYAAVSRDSEDRHCVAAVASSSPPLLRLLIDFIGFFCGDDFGLYITTSSFYFKTYQIALGVAPALATTGIIAFCCI
ncbi:unnamed protein product [Lactuca virosa]|uniref:Uncharacterized protein n=1 Tax=Lactuca virosa TaxID=75947 RepID=A0AAU9PSK7_9ASTR|nr:unnamed protein product [Lactuca virosa]